MKYMLDTNICIYIIKKQPAKVLTKFTTLAIGEICISSITVAELMYGVHKSKHKQKNQLALHEFLLPLEIMPFTEKTAFFYGELRSCLERKGKLIGSMDLMIAAHALSMNLTLVTNNKKEFARVPKLNIENWT